MMMLWFSRSEKKTHTEHAVNMGREREIEVQQISL